MGMLSRENIHELNFKIACGCIYQYKIYKVQWSIGVFEQWRFKLDASRNLRFPPQKLGQFTTEIRFLNNEHCIPELTLIILSITTYLCVLQEMRQRVNATFIQGT